MVRLLSATRPVGRCLAVLAAAIVTALASAADRRPPIVTPLVEDPDRPPYRIRELAAGINGLPTLEIVLSPSVIRARRLASGWKLEDALWPAEENADGGIAGACDPIVVTHTNASFEGGSYIVQAGFAEQEVAAASYTIPAASFPIRVDSSEMIFATSAASQQTVTEWAWLVYEGEPVGGALAEVYRSLDGDLPQIILPPGTSGVNLLVMIDPGDPEQLFIDANAQNAFTVGYRIDKHNAQTQNPCLVSPPNCCNAFPTTDVGGLAEPNRNWLFAVNCGPFGCPAGWRKFSQLGICTPSGDWVLRATYTPFGCAIQVGACCLPSGACDTTTQTDCALASGLYAGNGVPCQQVNCQPSVGACCLPDGTCETTGLLECPLLGGTFQGTGTSCEGTACPQQPGPCCFQASGGCLQLTAANCLLAGGVPGPAGQGCAGYICFPIGACCLPDGSCAGGLSPEECAALAGSFQGHATTCAGVNCPVPTGACCFATGFCLSLTESDCGLAGATWAGPGTTCADDNANGQPDGCERPSGVFGDLDGDGVVNGSDLGILLSQFGQSGSADLNGDGVVDGADLGLLLGAWTI